MAGRALPFGKYVLVYRLAMGGMAEIFLAKQGAASFEGFERFIVIKRILPNLSENDDFLRMFLDEARLAAQLNHPNIVQIYDIGAAGGQYFIAMEYLSGRDCRRLMKKAAKRGELVPMPFALQIVHSVCEGLEYAHTKADPTGRPLNIVHRDISPQNVHVTFDGAVKLLDFGIAKAETQMVETRAGVLKGKYSYMSPEQATGARVDRRSDIFSLGILLFEMTTGRRLFKSDNEMQTLRAVIEGTVPRPSTIVPGYPPELDDIVMRALQRPPADRYQTCREMQADIEAFMVSRGLSMTPARLGAYVKELTRDEVDPTQLPDVRNATIPVAPEEVGALEPMLEGGPEEGSDSIDDAPTRTPSRVGSDGSAAEPGTSTAPGEGSTPSALSGASASRSSLSLLVGQRPALSIGIASVVVALLTAAAVLWVVPSSPDGASAGPLPHQSSTPPLPRPEAPARPVQFGSIRVETTPVDAHVVFDGRPVADSTPATLAQVVVGQRHRVIASWGNLPPQTQDVELRADGETRTLRFHFATAEGGVSAERNAGSQAGSGAGSDAGSAVAVGPEPGVAGNAAAGGRRVFAVAVTIRSTPPTKIFFDNRAIGGSPATTRAPPGPHSVRCVDPSQEINFTTSVRVPEGAPFDTNVVVPRGTLKINVLPWANVTVNGRSLGQTPIPARQVFAGRFTVRLENPQLNRSETRTVTVPPGGQGVVALDWRQ